MIFVGIDPGKSGAVAQLGDEDRGVIMGNVKPSLTTWALPMIKGKGGKDEYDLPEIAARIRALASTADLFVTVEKGHALPPMKVPGRPELTPFPGGSANFHRGYSRGIFEGMLVALAIPHQLVVPRQWQKRMLASPGAWVGDEGTTKTRSIAAARSLFPDVDLRRTPRSRKDDDGIADAILLACYGRLSVRSEQLALEVSR